MTWDDAVLAASQAAEPPPLDTVAYLVRGGWSLCPITTKVGRGGTAVRGSIPRRPAAAPPTAGHVDLSGTSRLLQAGHSLSQDRLAQRAVAVATAVA
ncbi:hypothetical protein ACFRDV_20270 [Streptomyces fagopyri]|uniref:hypothetical protein n=1 Tax=Streptomyces fagopyri TaxID=2662397 RepID=UPI0036857BBC